MIVFQLMIINTCDALYFQLVEPIRYLLHYVGTEFEDKQYNIGLPPNDYAEWGCVKSTLGLEFPNVSRVTKRQCLNLEVGGILMSGGFNVC